MEQEQEEPNNFQTVWYANEILESMCSYWMDYIQSVFRKCMLKINIFNIEKMLKYVASNVFTYANAH